MNIKQLNEELDKFLSDNIEDTAIIRIKNTDVRLNEGKFEWLDNDLLKYEMHGVDNGILNDNETECYLSVEYHTIEKEFAFEISIYVKGGDFIDVVNKKDYCQYISKIDEDKVKKYILSFINKTM